MVTLVLVILAFILLLIILIPRTNMTEWQLCLCTAGYIGEFDLGSLQASCPLMFREGFFELHFRGDAGWRAGYWKDEYINFGPFGDGAGPEEAVANLWIGINSIDQTLGKIFVIESSI